MSPAETAAFRASPHAEAAVRLRRWDDGGKVDGILVPELAAYRGRIPSVALP
jgi:gamma-butyrobetaine dioxygenase